MKSSWTLLFAARLLERLLGASRAQALCGDLLEERHSGRSLPWCWRQIAAAAAQGASNAVSVRAPALLFSVFWTVLYAIAAAWLPRAQPDQWNAFSWPVPAVLELATGVLPAVVFLGMGFLVFQTLRGTSLHDLSLFRLVASLSAGMNVLLLSTVWLLHHNGRPQPDLVCVTQPDFYFPFHLFPFSVPLAASVLAALLVAHTSAPRLARRPRVPEGGESALPLPVL